MADPKLTDKNPRQLPTPAPRSVMSQGELKTLFRNRPTAQGTKPAGYLKDVNLPVDKPKSMAAPKKMTR